MPDISKVKLEINGPSYDIGDSYLREVLKDFDYSNPLSKNSIARGKDITSYYTDGSLYTRISDGSFDDLFVGDYITAKYNGTSTNFRIAGFNTFWGQGKAGNLLKTNHVVIVPDTKLTTGYMNSTSTTTGGYVGSYMNKSIIGTPVTAGSTGTVNGNLYNIFGDHLLTYYEYLTNSVNSNTASSGYRTQSGATNGNEWVQVQAVLMSEIELYGTQAFSSSGSDVGSGVTWLPLFRLMPQYKQYERYYFWLRNVVSTTRFAYCSSNGYAYCYRASNSYGVRPRFLIG